MDEDRNYAPPRLPIHPVITRETFGGERRAPVPSIVDVSPPRRFVSGRFGLAAALGFCGVGPSDDVLIPAYCCPAMVNPVRALDARPVFFKSNRDLSADLADVRAKITARTKCVLIVHYFGFLQELGPIRALCDERGIKLVEDCAHAFYGERDGRPVGSVGDFAFASPMKFFPMFDGGCLVSAGDRAGSGPESGYEDAASATSRRADTRYQLKAFANTLERAHAFGRTGGASFVATVMQLRRAAGRMMRTPKATNGASPKVSAPAALTGGYGFEERWRRVDMSFVSRAIWSRTSQDHLVRARRRNYQWLYDHCLSLEGARPFVPLEDESTVPYVFPLVVERPAEMFPKLKLAGVPLLRWDDANRDACPVSASYSRHLLMVPCHQALEEHDLEWIVSQLKRCTTDREAGDAVPNVERTEPQ